MKNTGFRNKKKSTSLIGLADFRNPLFSYPLSSCEKKKIAPLKRRSSVSEVQIPEIIQNDFLFGSHTYYPYRFPDFNFNIPKPDIPEGCSLPLDIINLILNKYITHYGIIELVNTQIFQHSRKLQLERFSLLSPFTQKKHKISTYETSHFFSVLKTDEKQQKVQKGWKKFHDIKRKFGRLPIVEFLPSAQIDVISVATYECPNFKVVVSKFKSKILGINIDFYKNINHCSTYDLFLTISKYVVSKIPSKRIFDLLISSKHKSRSPGVHISATR